MSATPTPAKAMTVRDFTARKRAPGKLVVATAYDVLFARLVDESGVDAILVGDSLGNVVAGFDSTLPVTLDQMIYHGAAVRRGTSAPSDRRHALPDLSGDTEDAMRTAARRAGDRPQAVKLEGGGPEIEPAVRRSASGLPSWSPRLTPQSVHALGGFRVQGRIRRPRPDGRAGAAAPGRRCVLDRARARAAALAAGSPKRSRYHDRNRRRRAVRWTGAVLPDCSASTTIRAEVVSATRSSREESVARCASSPTRSDRQVSV